MAGGAEVYVHRLLKSLAQRGHKVTLFCATFPGCRQRDTIDGIEHIRYAGRFLMYPKSILCYRRHICGRFDIIVESINGVPFFTPLFAKEIVIPFIHQLTRENWYSALPSPLAFTGYHLEDHLLRLYKNRPAMVPSESTKADLERLGFRNVTVIYGAQDIEPPEKITKEKKPTLIYLGRLTKSKRVDNAIMALKKVRESVPDALLWIAGSGPEENALKKLAGSLGLSDHVFFFGRISQQKKAELLSRAHLMLLPAVREGWGLVVLEASACGTPVIGYDVEGLRDSIKNGVNGYLVENGNVEVLASSSTRLLKDQKSLESLSESSVVYSKKFSWEKTADAFLILAESLS
jgi:glycosyltransferase involved in cell wall biosynthesis